MPWSGQFSQLEGSGPCRSAYKRGHVNQSSLPKRWTPKIRGSDPLRRAATGCTTPGCHHPFFFNVGTASVRVRQQAHGMAKFHPRSSLYLLDPAPRGPSFQHLHLTGNPLCSSISTRYSHDTESNVFIMSSFRSKAGSFSRWYALARFHTNRKFSWMHRSLIKAYHRGANLQAKTFFEMSLLKSTPNWLA
jgi:hypothetical protein